MSEQPIGAQTHPEKGRSPSKCQPDGPGHKKAPRQCRVVCTITNIAVLNVCSVSNNEDADPFLYCLLCAHADLAMPASRLVDGALSCSWLSAAAQAWRALSRGTVRSEAPAASESA